MTHGLEKKDENEVLCDLLWFLNVMKLSMALIISYWKESLYVNGLMT